MKLAQFKTSESAEQRLGVLRGDVVYDPFLGSGTTLVAAQTTDRLCYGMDIDPAYVDVIVRRWQQLTGKSAVLEADGHSFEEVAMARQLVTEEV